MEYCINYFENARGLTGADQINIKYHENSEKESLKQFLLQFPQRINILIDFKLNSEVVFRKIIQDIAEVCLDLNRKNIYIRVYDTIPSYANDSQEELLKIAEIIKEYNLPFYFGLMALHPLTIVYFASLGVSEVYITENLGFSLSNTRKIADAFDLKIRAIPNISQKSFKSINPIKGFFIRPDDIDFFEKFIDTLEFAGPVDKNSLLLEIYKEKQWFGNLNEIILEQPDIDNRCIPSEFAQIRSNCDLKCLKKIGKCRFCEEINFLAKSLAKQGLFFTTEPTPID